MLLQNGSVISIGPGWSRTNVGLRQWVYSPSPLTTRAPTLIRRLSLVSRKKKFTICQQVLQEKFSPQPAGYLQICQ